MSFLRARSGTEDFDMLIDTKLRVCSNMRTSQELPTSRKQLISDPLASQVSDDDDDDAIVPRAIAAPDKVSPEELDAFLTNELTRLSMEERDQIAQELHCITETIDEEPAFVSKRLSELEHELDLLPSVDVDAYRKAHSANPSYTTDRSFRLQFLRAERFNAKAAAERLARYFREKIQLFPELVRGRFEVILIAVRYHRVCGTFGIPADLLSHLCSSILFLPLHRLAKKLPWAT